jgi:tetratricopeptide (TPR) repeat protein
MEGALAAYREAIVIDDTDAWSMNNMALALIEEERFEEALPAAARAAELDGDVSVFNNNLGIALERTGHPAEAERAYQAALTIDSEHDRAAANLARVQVAERDSTAEPIELATLARSFVERIDEWRGSTVALEIEGGAVSTKETGGEIVEVATSEGTFEGPEVEVLDALSTDDPEDGLPEAAHEADEAAGDPGGSVAALDPDQSEADAEE